MVKNNKKTGDECTIYSNYVSQQRVTKITRKQCWKGLFYTVNCQFQLSCIVLLSHWHSSHMCNKTHAIFIFNTHRIKTGYLKYLKECTTSTLIRRLTQRDPHKKKASWSKSPDRAQYHLLQIFGTAVQLRYFFVKIIKSKQLLFCLKRRSRCLVCIIFRCVQWSLLFI